METNDQLKLRFYGVDITNLIWNSMQAFTNNEHVEFCLSPKVFYPEDNKLQFKIIMDMSLKCKTFFELSLIAIGNFEVNIDLDDIKTKKQFVNINAPAIMFPYVRSFITTFSSNTGSASVPLIIPTKFFSGELEEVATPSSIQ
jgi:preprotein translocase subunit SecB